MKKTTLLLLVASGLAAWFFLFPRDEKVIQKRLGKLAKTVSVQSSDGNFKRIAAAHTLVDFFTPQVELNLRVLNRDADEITSREELRDALIAVQNQVRQANVELKGFTVEIQPGRTNAVAIGTASADINGEKYAFLQELKFEFVKQGRDWLIRKVETLDTVEGNL